ncbi:MAG: AraC family transcriptional regulator [Firmicutes bacterium HGW-Firmicutes-7]|nr:MAG: AraC family transcriptional regulator [Firmicutes bacterium HGW-Firmicutes-7]
MNANQLDRMLHQLNEIEEKFKDIANLPDTQKSLKDVFSREAIDANWIINIDKLVKEDELVSIHRHDRFMEFDLHSHDYIELIFVYSGTIKQVIERKDIELKKGEILLLDMNVKHKISVAGEEDIAINILLKKEFFDWVFMSHFSKNDIIFDFIAKAIYDNKKTKQYLLFRTSENNIIWDMMIKILMEYYEPKIGMDTAIRSYIALLFTELFRDYRHNLNQKIVSQIDITINSEVVNFIDKNYKTITLAETAEHFNFNVDYMGKLIKNITGNSFTSFIKDRKFEQACCLLRHSQDSVTEIVNNTGYSNVSYFYKQFKQKYGVTPDEYRNKAAFQTTYE